MSEGGKKKLHILINRLLKLVLQKKIKYKLLFQSLLDAFQI